MKKNWLSTLLAVIMVLGLIPARIAFAEVTYSATVPDGWVLHFPKTDTQAAAGKREALTATGESYSGNSSMYLHFDTSDVTANKYAYLWNLGLTGSISEAGIYTLSFYMKNELETNPGISVRAGGANKWANNSPDDYQCAWVYHATITDAEDSVKAAEGWKKYTFTLTDPSSFNFVIEEVNSITETKVYIDDMTLTTPGVAGNLLFNGDFEGVAAVNAPVNKELLYDWYTTYKWGNKAGKTQEVTTDEAYSGQKSLYVAVDADTTNALIIQNAGAQDALTSGGTYTLSFYAKGLTRYNDNRFVVAGNWWNRYTPWERTGRGNKRLTEFYSSVPENKEKAAAGWRKYSSTFTLSETPSIPQLLLEKQCAFYIDDITLTDSNGTNLFLNSDMEGVTSAPTTEEALYQWNISKSATDVQGDATIANGVAYSGNSSMHITWDSANGSKNATITNDGIATLPGSGEYTLSFYAKGAMGSSVQTQDARVQMGNTWLNKWYNDNNASTGNIVRFSEFTVSIPENAEKAAEGWRKYTRTIPNPTKFDMLIQFAYDVDWYLDDFTLTASGSTENLFANSSFEDRYVPPFPDLSGKPVDSPWVINAVNAATAGYTYKVETSEAEAFSDKRSLHVMYSGGNAADPLIIYPEYTPQRGDTFEVTFYAKVITGLADIKCFPFHNIWAPFTSNIETTDTGKDGWVKYKFSGTVGNNDESKKIQQFSIRTTGANAEYYLDDFTIKINGAPVDAINATGGFEYTSTDPFDVSDVVFCDADNTQLEGLTDALSGQQVKLGVAVTNNEDTPMTAQLIIALYNGYEMVDFAASDVTTINKADGAVTLIQGLTLPEYDTVGNYEVRAYVWDSLKGLRALAPSVAVF